MGESSDSNMVEFEVEGIIASCLAINREKVKLHNNLKDDLGADSLDAVEIIMELEDKYNGLNIPDEDAQKLVTVGDLVKYVQDNYKP